MNDDSKPSIAELQHIVAAMSEAPWTTERPQTDADGWPAVSAVAAVARGQALYSPATRGISPEADRQGIAALRNAGPLLLEIVAAALAARAAVCTTQTEDWDLAERDDTLCFGAIHCDSCPVTAARAVHDAALAKVQP